MTGWNFKDDIDDDCEDDDIEEESQFVIECFGRTKNDESIYVKINGLRHFSMLKFKKME